SYLIPPACKLHMRLYGGWFEGSRLSRRGQLVSADAASISPLVVTLSRLSIVATIEMSYSLMIDPGHNLENTFRIRSLQDRLRCSSPPFRDCLDIANCPTVSLHTLISNVTCPLSSCTVQIHTLLSKPEQKLVDTMLTSDMITLAIKEHGDVVLVTG